MDSSKFWKYLISVFLLTDILIVVCLFSFPDNNLHIITCDVGQGDATLITNNSNQILIDGGPDNSVLNCLGSHMPFWDRTIELVILTHPQSDHYTGLIEVFRRYEVNNFLANDVDSSNQGYKVLEKEVGSRGVRVVRPVVGQKLRLGLMYLDILWPVEEEFKDPNDYSIVNKLTFGSFKAVLTGDLEENKASDLMRVGGLEDVDYIKVSHHGSSNGVTNKLLNELNPEVAVISAGKNNRYGHPHPETINLLKNQNIKIFGTYEIGDIEIISDGKTYWTKN